MPIIPQDGFSNELDPTRGDLGQGGGFTYTSVTDNSIDIGELKGRTGNEVNSTDTQGRDGSVAGSHGCMDGTAINYDAEAKFSSGDCDYGDDSSLDLMFGLTQTELAIAGGVGAILIYIVFIKK